MNRPVLKQWTSRSIIMLSVAGYSFNLQGTTYSGLYGHTVEGYAQAVGPISNLQNGSNLSPPSALVGNGPEFWADFRDVFGTPWHLTVDFQDNYQVVFQTGSSNPSANISSGTVGWNLTGFDFMIANFQSVSLPPSLPAPVVSFDQNSIYVGFPVIAAYAPYDTYTYQIVPTPEPGTLTLAGLGVLLVMARRNDRLS
jgi:hypothetical protein